MVPLCALAVPLIDMSLAIIRRRLRGSPIFVADARHIHHRLLARGLTPRAVTVVLVVASSLFALVAMSVLLAPHQAQLQIGLLGGLIVVTVAVSGIRQLKYDEFSEAASALSDVLRSRRVVNDLIRAREATERIVEAGTIEQLNTVLHESAIAIGLRNIEVVPTEVALDIAHYNASVPLGHTWTFHCPVAGGTMGSSDYFLTITGDARHEGSLYGAERLAESLVPRLEAWFARATAMRIDADIARASGNVVLRADSAPEHSLDDVDLTHVPLGTPNRSRARSRGMSSANDFPISRAGPPSSSGPRTRACRILRKGSQRIRMTSFSWVTVALAVLAVPVFPKAGMAQASAPRALRPAVDTTALTPATWSASPSGARKSSAASSS